jgi:membrane protein implicated in regulation of membrane protease activity
MSMEPWHIWTIVGVVLLAIEMATVTLVIYPFAIGAFAAAIATALGLATAPAIGVFVVAGLPSYLLLRPYLAEQLKGAPHKTGLDLLIGKEALVLRDVTDLDGLVKINGQQWSARTEAGIPALTSDSRVTVERIDGATLIVNELDPALL